MLFHYHFFQDLLWRVGSWNLTGTEQSLPVWPF